MKNPIFSLLSGLIKKNKCIIDCPFECITETVFLEIKGYSDLAHSENKLLNLFWQIMIIIQRSTREENIYHLQAISLTSYLCSIGGILSMWIGISIWREGRRLFRAISLRNKSNFSKAILFFSYSLFIVICLAFASLQTINTLKQFFSYEYMVRVSSHFQFEFPSLEFILTTQRIISKVEPLSMSEIEIYEQRKSLIDNYFNTTFLIDCQIISLTPQRNYGNESGISCDIISIVRNCIKYLLLQIQLRL
jgi:hypothetical protein